MGNSTGNYRGTPLCFLFLFSLCLLSPCLTFLSSQFSQFSICPTAGGRHSWFLPQHSSEETADLVNLPQALSSSEILSEVWSLKSFYIHKVLCSCSVVFPMPDLRLKSRVRKNIGRPDNDQKWNAQRLDNLSGQLLLSLVVCPPQSYLEPRGTQSNSLIFFSGVFGPPERVSSQAQITLFGPFS